MTDFKPTIFYIKQHLITGLKYFGKTTNIDVSNSRYKGGGKYWKLHIKKHGSKHVVTLWKSKVFTDKNECIAFGLTFSKEHNIVESNEWANLEPENGINGFVSGFTSPLSGRKLTEEHKQNISKSLKGRECPTKGKTLPTKGKPRSEETKKKISDANKGRPSNKKGKPNNGASAANKGVPKKKVECPVCKKIGSVTVWYKHHFNNCKNKTEKLQ